MRRLVLSFIKVRQCLRWLLLLVHHKIVGRRSHYHFLLHLYLLVELTILHPLSIVLNILLLWCEAGF